jgi:hypothetical protein
MNRVFDYNGTMVAPSNPVKKLKTVKKIFVIDSGDRDYVKYPTNGDFVVYLPRVYENVVSIRLEAGEFPSCGYYDVTSFLLPPTTPPTVPPPVPFIETTGLASNSTIGIPSDTLYFLIDIEGLNKKDECSLGADRSGYPDGHFAKIPLLGGILPKTSKVDNTTVAALNNPKPTFYSDSGAQENIAYYTPAIGKLDRMHIRTRLHTQKASGDWFFWTTGEYSLTFEIEYLDNVFDDFSQFESRISDRG